jgi:hypothetical protein
MRDTFRLFVVVLEAALIATAGSFLSILASSLDESWFYATPGGLARWQTLASALEILIPTGAAAWWIFRRLRARYSRREVRAASITFALITPVLLWFMLALSEFPGGPRDRPGAIFVLELFGVTTVITSVPNLAACSFALWLARQG